jgi:hypothetical protein
MTTDDGKPFTLKEILEREWAAIETQRAQQDPKDPWRTDSRNRFGIALSGGGLRAATIAGGFLDTLNRFGMLEGADYLSSVSGGGYAAGYVHGTLWSAAVPRTAFQRLFSKEDYKRLQAYRDYLTPGQKLRGLFSWFKFTGALLANIVLNGSWVGALAVALYFLVSAPWHAVGGRALAVAGQTLVDLAVVVLLYHLAMHWTRHWRMSLWSSDVLNRLEGWLLLAALLYGTSFRVSRATAQPPLPDLERAGIALIVAGVLGVFVNPNVLTMHRFYRDRIGDAYLWRAPRVRLHRLRANGGAWRQAPYPLINTCLNLEGRGDPSFQGARASDYFLLSPLFCGAKLTGYRATDSSSFRGITLATAIAISGAAVNPEMGWRTNKVLAFVMAVLSLRLGYWVRNPRFDPNALATRVLWWPAYQLLELLSLTDTWKRLLNVSDGGHIENLGVYELLRRHCKFIVVLDATEDPDYAFGDLRNLMIRARQELGVTITFRQAPEDFIRPPSSNGFSRSHFVVADVAELQGKRAAGEEPYQGVLVYGKSSLRAQGRWKTTGDPSFLYKTYHPAFPHESTADQFFDNVQWEAYYSLGRFVACDVLQADCTKPEVRGRRGIGEFYSRLAGVQTGQDLEDYLAGVRSPNNRLAESQVG